MGDLSKVVGAHLVGGNLYTRLEDGTVICHSGSGIVVPIPDEDQDGLVWQAIERAANPLLQVKSGSAADQGGVSWGVITGSQGRTASTVSPDSPELAALREIDRALQAVWDVALECWLNEQTALYVIREAVDRALQARS